MKGLRISVLVACVVLTGCGAVAPHIEMVGANYAYGRGELQSALIAYLSLYDSMPNRSEVAYNLGGLYHSLGEPINARQAWEEALASTELQTRAFSLHNLGVLAYEQGDFSSAYDFFRASLVLVPANAKTKTNLELSYQKIQGEALAGTAPDQPQNRIPPSLSRESERVLRYVQRQESELWFPSESASQGDREVEW